MVKQERESFPRAGFENSEFRIQNRFGTGLQQRASYFQRNGTPGTVTRTEFPLRFA
jgi:hypothetical protein